MATIGTRNKKIQESESKAILDATKNLDLSKVIGEVSGLQVNVQNSLASLSAALTAKIQNLNQIDTSITLKEQRLQELYSIENIAITLDEMKSQKEQEERLHTEQKSVRAKHWLEEENERSKIWERTIEEKEYARNLQEKKFKDDFDIEVATCKRNEQIRQEMLNKSWTDRENALKSKETEFVELQKQVNGFDAKLKSEVTKAELILSNSLKKDHSHQIELMKKDAESCSNVALMKVAAQERIIMDLQSQIKELQSQLDHARADSKEIATQALQSASGRQVADALQRVVDTKDANGKNSK